MAVSRLEDGAGTHKNKLPLSVELQNALDSNGRHEELLYGGGIYNVNGRGMTRLLGIGCGAKKTKLLICGTILLREHIFTPFAQIQKKSQST